MESSNSVCRICLLEGHEFVPMFGGDSELKYHDLIKEYTGLEMVQHESLSAVICTVCSSELLTVIRFISKCRLSYEKFQQVLDIKASFNDLPVITPNIIVKEEDIPLSILSTAIKEEIHEDLNESDRDFDSQEVFNHSEDDYKPEKKEKSHLKHGKTKKKHKKTLKKESLQCLHCGLLVPSQSALLVHNRKHTGEKPFKCPYCDNCFSQGGTLSEHIKRKHFQGKYTSERSFTCDTCGKQFLKNGDLRIHMRVHTKEKPYQCSYCKRCFSQVGTLNQHKMLHTGERPHACDVCGRKFIALTTLRRHSIVHTDEKKFKCHICDKRLKSSLALKKHLIFLHTSEKPNICQLCGAAFAAKSNLKSHLRHKHSEYSGICEICKKHFSNLANHLRIHTGETPFQCHICSRKFSQKRSLTSHINMHEKATKFACTFESCDKAFSMKCKLEFHVLKFHSNHTPHICQFCSKGFYRISDMTKHIKATHGKKSDSPILKNSMSNTFSNIM